MQGGTSASTTRRTIVQSPEDAVIGLTSSAIWGTDLHFVRGTMGV